jgi:hypothetical protein
MSDEDNVSPDHKKLMDDIIYLRGRILTSYAQVEFLLADISVKLDLKFPYLIAARLKAAKCIADREGFEVYRQELIEVCDGLADYDDIRKYMAHGWSLLTVDKAGNHIFELLMYERVAEGEFKLTKGAATREQLHAAAEDILNYSAKVVNLFRRIYKDKNLE